MSDQITAVIEAARAQIAAECDRRAEGWRRAPVVPGKLTGGEQAFAALELESLAAYVRSLGPVGPALADMRDALEDMTNQFAYEAGPADGVPRIFTGGLSALEHAFDVLGWPDPKPVPERKCQREGCDGMETCGRPTANGGYERVCGDHFSEAEGGA